jgi:Ger(x)C family germination protein
MKWKWMIFLITLPLCLTACWDSQEIEHTRYLYAMGIDYKEHKIKVYVQVISFSNVAKQEGPGGQTVAQPIWIGTGEAKSFDGATDQIYLSAQQRISWSHLAALVFSEEALKHPEVIQSVLDTTTRYNEIRSTIWVYGTKSPIIDLFTAKPVMSYSPAYSKLTSPMSNFRQYSTSKPIQLYEFIAQLKDGSKTAILPFLGTSRNYWNKDKAPFEVTVNDGIGVIQNNCYMGHLSQSEIQGLRWVYKNTQRAPLFLYNDGKILGSIIFRNPKTKIIPKVANNKLVYTINVKGKGRVIQMDQASTEKELTKKAITAIRKEINNTYLQGVKRDADLYRLSDALYRRDPKSWHKLRKIGKLKIDSKMLSKINVEVVIINSGKTKLKRTGRSVRDSK